MEQLAMRWGKSPLSINPSPPGIIIRTYAEADREALKDALIPLTEKRYDDTELNNIIIHKPGVRTEGIFLAEENGEIVGTTTGYFNEDGTSGTLHMVSVLTQANGKGLGRVLCQHAMRFLIENGCDEVVLTTDDFRLPAIKTYLRLGFEPIIKNDEMQNRWTTVLNSLT
jgi:mycothiol synthase